MTGGDGLTLPDVTFSTCSAVEAAYTSCSIAGIKRLADVQALSGARKRGKSPDEPPLCFSSRGWC